MTHDTIPLDTWMNEPEYAEARAEYFGVKLACGHVPASPTGHVWAKCGMPSTTGYGTDPKTGEKLCHECCAERDTSSAMKNGRGFFYLVERKAITGKVYVVTTWPGIQVSGHVRILNRWKNNFGDTRVAFRCEFRGEIWSGSGPGEGMYCRIKRTKLADLYA
jgi:hypothetical protein